MSRRICRAALLVLLVGCGGPRDAVSPPAADRAQPDAAIPAASVPAIEPRPSRDEPQPVTPAVPGADEAPVAPQPVARPADDRPRHDDAALARVGVRRFASRRLVLYTDVPAEIAERLPPLADALFDAHVAYFGPLPPARDGSDYQATGYLMADRGRFADAGLIPVDLPPFLNGRHRGLEFWMNDQPFDYYRRHLLLHEATHCFMTRLPGTNGPPWYMEGMAERFGTHRIGPDGSVTFRVMPTSPEEFGGFGRITLLRDEIAAGRFATLAGVGRYDSEAFLKNEPYAWSWAACTFLDTHPAYRDRFRELGDVRFRQRFDEEFPRLFGADRRAIDDGWAVFAHSLCFGYEPEAAAIAFEPTSPAGGPIAVAAGRGWQSSGVRVERGRRYAVTAAGRFTLADAPKPWDADAGGITFDYHDGRPLGLLLAAVRADVAAETGAAAKTDAASGLLSPIAVGRAATVTAPADGTLFFRLNDVPSRRSDDRDGVTVEVRPVDGATGG